MTVEELKELISNENKKLPIDIDINEYEIRIQYYEQDGYNSISNDSVKQIEINHKEKQIILKGYK